MAWGKKSWSLKGLFSASTPDALIDQNTWSDLEDTLLSADFGPDISEDLVARVRAEVERIGTHKASDVTAILREVIEDKLASYDSTLRLTERPAVVLVVGVNGVGKTTTIGKFARFLTSAGRSVVLAAADTFRAAAVEQLTTWATRADVGIVLPEKDGQDPASVAYQAVEKALAEGIDIVVIDTAGRLHTKAGLMDELGKIRRVVEKVAPVSEVLLVLDATTGQNGVLQAQAFLEHAGVTGLVVTKLDGSAKAGFVMRVQELTGLPIKLLGQGESIDDMTGFSPAQFAKALTS
jgi:fused signal recognition particle receptor